MRHRLFAYTFTSSIIRTIVSKVNSIDTNPHSSIPMNIIIINQICIMFPFFILEYSVV